MSTKIYVGGLNDETTDTQLQELFTKHGTVVSTAIVMEKGVSKGFGFVEMQHAEEAQKAITILNGKDFAERKLTVNQARPQQDRGSGRTAYQGNTRSY
jgi:cold-inducible RNA-binding protein